MKKIIIPLLAFSILFGNVSGVFAQTTPTTTNSGTISIQEKQLVNKLKSIKKKTTVTKKKIKTNIAQTKKTIKKVKANRLKVKKIRAAKKM